MCRIDWVDDDGGFWREDPHKVTARKNHRCSDCGRTIAKGEPYSRGVWLRPREGYHAVHMCQHCIAAGAWLHEVCGGHLWPGVIEELEEHWYEAHVYRSFGLGRLVLAGRCGWQGVTVEQVAHWVDAALRRIPLASAS